MNKIRLKSIHPSSKLLWFSFYRPEKTQNYLHTYERVHDCVKAMIAETIQVMFEKPITTIFDWCGVS